MKKTILVATIFSVILVIWTNFEIIPLINCDCNHKKLNDIISNLALAIISASIFYFIDVYIKEVVE